MTPSRRSARCSGPAWSTSFTLMMEFIFGPILFFLTSRATSWTASSRRAAGRWPRRRAACAWSAATAPPRARGSCASRGTAAASSRSRTLPGPVDLSSFELATFRFRLNRQTPGTDKLFFEDVDGHRSVWRWATPRWPATSGCRPSPRRWTCASTSSPERFPAVRSEATTRRYDVRRHLAVDLDRDRRRAPAGSDARRQRRRRSQPGRRRISGTPTANGTFDFTMRAPTGLGATSTQALRIEVGDPPSTRRSAGPAQPGARDRPPAGDLFPTLPRRRRPMEPPPTSRGSALRLRALPGHGHAAGVGPRRAALGSSALERQLGENNFIIRGSEFSALQPDHAAERCSRTGAGAGPTGRLLQNLLELLNTEFDLSSPASRTPAASTSTACPACRSRTSSTPTRPTPTTPR